MDQNRCRILSVLFMSLANLTRPDSWPSTYLLILAFLGQRFFNPEGPEFRRADLWFLIPMGMPLVWMLLDWGFFGDPLYSRNIARTFGREYLSAWDPQRGHESDVVAEFFPKLKETLLTVFSVSTWLSIKGGLLTILFAVGVGTMLRREPRILLLVSCPFLGTLLFYFVYAFGGSLFRKDYIQAALVCITLVVSLGLGSLCGLARSVGPRAFGAFLQAALACTALLFLAGDTFQQTTVKKSIPALKELAASSQRPQPAIEALVADVDQTSGSPIIVTTKWVPASRIALQRGTGEGLFMVERLVAKEKIGEEELLPDLAGRTVYYCFNRTMREEMVWFMQPLMNRSKRTEEIYNQDGLVVLKCFY
jgi:hypothetical protein